MEDEKTTDKKNETPEIICTTDLLLEAFLAFYEPAQATDPAAEPKTTNDIIEEMETIDEVSKGIVASYLGNNGYKISYSEAGPCWYVKQKVNS